MHTCIYEFFKEYISLRSLVVTFQKEKKSSVSNFYFSKTKMHAVKSHSVYFILGRKKSEDLKTEEAVMFVYILERKFLIV